MCLYARSRAVVIVEVERDGARKRAVEILDAGARVGDARDREVFVHQELFRSIGVEVDAIAGPADELAALGILVSACLRIESDRRCESAARQCRTKSHEQAVGLRVGSLRPDDIAEPSPLKSAPRKSRVPADTAMPVLTTVPRPAGPPRAIANCLPPSSSADRRTRRRWNRTARRCRWSWEFRSRLRARSRRRQGSAG